RGAGDRRLVHPTGGGAPQLRRTRQAELRGDLLGDPGVHQVQVRVAHRSPSFAAGASRIIATAWPPAAHTEISPRAGLSGSASLARRSSLASVATIRAQVAAHGAP